MFSSGGGPYPRRTLTRKGEPSVRPRIHQAVDDERVECALALYRFGPDHVQCGTLDRIVRFAKHVEQQAADLAVGAGEALPPRRRPGGLWCAGCAPGAAVRERA